MTRNWGIPTKRDQAVFRRARTSRPIATLGLTAIYGVIGAAVAAMSFNDARALIDHLFHGPSLIWAVVTAGFGCWFYVWLARARFAAHFTGEGDAFSDLLRFYARGAAGLIVVFIVGNLSELATGELLSVLILCAAGGAGAAAAFQTVLAFVPGAAAAD
jgi:hypothetical protein